jgi:phage shock protein PspC (stress-responsive transcriptional regulator)
MENKRLYRSASDKVFGGVAGGIAEYFAIDPVIIRVIFVLLAIFGGGGLLIYIVLWIALQEKGSATNPTESSFEMPHFQKETDFKPACPRDNKTFNLVIAILLIGIGATLLLDHFLMPVVFRHFWPVLLVVAGVFLLVRSFEHKK